MLRVWDRKTPPTALTIAGSDSGGGAGIQADLKTFLAFGVHGLVAITSVTSQNTLEVRDIHDIPPSIVASQIKAVAEDIGVDAAKTGMLSNREIIDSVAKAVEKLGFPLVVDPVMIAKSGARLLREDAVNALKNKLLPTALLVTPNKMEAEILAEMKIKSINDAKVAAKKISAEYGVRGVIIKGGHLGLDYSVDILYYDGGFREYRSPYITNGCTHGTGCSFSAAITANIAWGIDIYESIKKAKEFITLAIQYGLNIGKGHCPVNPGAWIHIPAEKYIVLEELKKAAQKLSENSEILLPFTPEVQINLVMSLPYWYAKTINDVAGFPGRIVRVGRKLYPVRPPEFGASKHMATAVLTLMKYDSSKRAGMNLLFNRNFVEKAEELGYLVSWFDREEEPPEVRDKEGATTPWGIETAVKRTIDKGVPDIIVDSGGYGKEPLIMLFSTTATNVVEMAVKIASSL